MQPLEQRAWGCLLLLRPCTVPLILISSAALTFESVLGTVGAIRLQHPHVRHSSRLGGMPERLSACRRAWPCMAGQQPHCGLQSTIQQVPLTAPGAEAWCCGTQAGLASEPWVRQAVLSSSPSLEGAALSAQVRQLQGLLQQVHQLGAEGAAPVADSEVCPCCTALAGPPQLWLACVLSTEQAGGRCVAAGTTSVPGYPLHCFCL